jgi:hypothetical protein
MNLVQAIEAVKKDNTKVYEEKNGRRVEICKFTVCPNKGSVTFNDLHTGQGINIEELANLDFKEVVDWSKVKVDARVIITTKSRNSSHCGRSVKRHFVKYCDGRIVTFDSGVTSWTDVGGNTTSWEPDEVTLAE